jgi:hypothetical protein
LATGPYTLRRLVRAPADARAGRTRHPRAAPDARLAPAGDPCERGPPAGTGAPRGLELLLQALVLPAQAITFAFEVTLAARGLRQLLAQLRDLPLLTIDHGIAIFGLEPACACSAGVMPQSKKKYNPKLGSVPAVTSLTR